MDELRGPHIQIVLHVKEGLGFGFLKTPFIVSGSLNGYMLETDPVIPCHGPAFDAELVWEADKRRFRSLRVQNVPVKVEVFSVGTQGKKDKIGYLLLSLLGAQPCPNNKVIEVKNSWHRLLGVKAEGKCCHPQLQLSLTIEDRINTPTPRNELRLFHNTESVCPPLSVKTPTIAKTFLPSLDEYIAESKKTPKSLDLQPKLICDEGLIQIGDGKQLFILSFVIGTMENVDMLMPSSQEPCSKTVDCSVTYSVFTHDITTDTVSVDLSRGENRAQLNQRTWLRLRSTLNDLALYFSECRLVAKVCVDVYPGMFSIDLRKLVPTDEMNRFLVEFCNTEQALTIQERCFILPSERTLVGGYKRPYIDVEMSLKYAGESQEVVKPNILSARSASQLGSASNRDPAAPEAILSDCRSGSCTNLNQNIGAGYTNITDSNTARYKNASGDAILQTSEIAELIRKMYESFTLNQEKILATRERPLTSDMQIQCDPLDKGQKKFVTTEKDKGTETGEAKGDSEENKLEVGAINSARSLDRESSKQIAVMCENCEQEKRKKDIMSIALSKMDREEIMKKFVDELENWKEKQQELFKRQLKQKEEYHLDLLSREWDKRRCDLECKLNKGIGQCRHLAGELSRATEELRLRGFRNTEREKKLLDAKNTLEAHYTAKYQELREASQKMEDDMNHQLRMKHLNIEELELKLQQAERHIETLKSNIKNTEKETESRYSGLTKDQTASLIQELRCLEEKLDSAVQSKAFFKEQWGRAVRELHLIKLHTRKQMLTQLKQDRRQLGDMGLETIPDQEDEEMDPDPIDIRKSKDDFYVDILANTPALDSHSMISTSDADGMQLFQLNMNAPKNPLNEKLNELISKRDKLVETENPDEELLKQLNHDIRSLLLNCGN